MSVAIELPARLTHNHVAVLTAYVMGQYLSPAERRTLFAAVDILAEAVVITPEAHRTFREVYTAEVDARLATPYLQALLVLDDVAHQSSALAAAYVRQVRDHLRQTGLYDPSVPTTRLLDNYCAYRWQSFARGYAFELEILRDLERAGIVFHAHDILDPFERYAESDLIVLGLQGDIKTSAYFLQTQPLSGLRNDFYITSLYIVGHRRILVVFLKPSAWAKINGDTVPGTLDTIAALLPAAVKLQRGQVALIVIGYEEWKERILRKQR